MIDFDWGGKRMHAELLSIFVTAEMTQKRNDKNVLANTNEGIIKKIRGRSRAC